MGVGSTMVLIVLIVCVYNLLDKFLTLESEKEEKCNKRVEKHKKNYACNCDIKLENKQLEDTLSSDIWGD